MDVDTLTDRLLLRSTYPNASYMIAIPTGWVDLIDTLDKNLTKLDPDYRIDQVKSKFGGLRFYYQTSLTGEQRDQFSDLVLLAEEASNSLCEQCGEEGYQRSSSGGWIWTLCEEHWAQRGDPYILRSVN